MSVGPLPAFHRPQRPPQAPYHLLYAPNPYEGSQGDVQLMPWFPLRQYPWQKAYPFCFGAAASPSVRGRGNGWSRVCTRSSVTVHTFDLPYPQTSPQDAAYFTMSSWLITVEVSIFPGIFTHFNEAPHTSVSWKNQTDFRGHTLRLAPHWPPQGFNTLLSVMIRIYIL